MSEKILVVDDHQAVVETMFSILEKSGYLVDKAYNAEECLKKIEENDIKLLFLDIMMPGLNGYEVAKQVRDKRNKDIKIFYVTIKPRAEVNLEHADGYIQKPFGVDQILSIVRQTFPDI